MPISIRSEAVEVNRSGAHRVSALGRRKALLACLACVAACFHPPAAAVDPTESAIDIWFDDLSEPLPFDPQEDALARARIVSRLVGPLPPASLPERVGRDRAPRLVFVSVGADAGPARVHLGRGPGLAAALRDALGQASGSTDSRLVKIDLVSRVDLQEGFRFSQRLLGERGRVGVAFARGSGVALLPDELAAQRLLDGRGRLRPDRIASYLAERPRAGSPARELASEPRRLFRFETESYLRSAAGVVPLYRGHRRFESVTRKELESSARLAGEYLLRSIDVRGRYDYVYWADLDRVPPGYNILRHAGTTYSLLELHERTPDDRLLHAAEGALDHLLGYLEKCPAVASHALCVVEDGKIKLGGNALAILALSKHAELTGSREHVPTLERLAAWIVAVQEESGRFTSQDVSFPSGEDSGFVSRFYPGEAVFALGRLHRIEPREEWIDAADRGARWLVEVRDAGLRDEQLPSDHWLLYALGELYGHRPRPIFLRHALRMADSIAAKQLRTPRVPDWEGGYGAPPRSTPTATRSEGLGAVLSLAREHGTAEQCRAILGALDRGVAFQLRTQLLPAAVLHVPNPPRALGGFRADLTSYEVRIDYVQHNLSSLLLRLAARDCPYP